MIPDSSVVLVVSRSALNWGGFSFILTLFLTFLAYLTYRNTQRPR